MRSVFPLGALAALALALLTGARLGRGADSGSNPFDLTLYRDGDSYLRPTLALEAAILSESNAYMGASRNVIGDRVGWWWEWAVTPGLEGALALGGCGLLYGRASAIGAGSQGLDAAGSNFDDRYPERLAVEDLYLGWKSGGLFPSLGENALQVSVGKQRYRIPSCFFLCDGASDGGARGAYWIGPRRAFYLSGIVRLETGPYLAELFYLKPNDAPFTATNVAGANFEYTAGTFGRLGTTYMNVYDSQRASRDGMNFFDWRLALTPVPVHPAFSVSGEYALELNGAHSHSYAWYAESGYQFIHRSWTPYLSYRYAFSGGDKPHTSDSEVWDPLWYGSSDWSTWYVGEIIGGFVSTNRGLVMQTVRLRANPTESLTTTFVYNYYRLSEPVSEVAARDLNPRAANIRSKHIGQEFDFINDWAATGWLAFSAVIAAFDPGAGAQQYVQSNSGSWWLHFMLYSKVSF